MQNQPNLENNFAHLRNYNKLNAVKPALKQGSLPLVQKELQE